MHTNETTIAGLFRTTTPSHHLARQLREKFTALAVDLGKLLPVTPNTTAALRSLRGSLDAAMLAATDAAADEAAPASSGSSASSPSSGSSSGSSASPDKPGLIDRILGRGTTPEAEPAPSPATPPATPATQEGPSTSQVLGPDGAPVSQPRKR